MLTKLTLEGFKSFRKLELELRALNVLIGANGAGKSNLVSFLRLLNQIAAGRLVYSVAQSGGPDTMLRFGKKHTRQIAASLEFTDGTYQFRLEPTAIDAIQFVYEAFLNPSRDGISTNPGSATSESRMYMTDMFAELFQDYRPVYLAFREKLTGIRTYHFNDASSTAGIKSIRRINDNLGLRSDGENLAAILYLIQIQNPKVYQFIRDVIRSVAPYFDDFFLQPKPANQDTIQLEWRERDSDYPFFVSDLSDGTLRFMALTTLLLQPNPPAITVIDEPELGLHPFAIEKLAGLLQVASSRTQLIVATQSPQLISALEPEDVIVADREEGETVLRRLDAESLKGWLEEYTLGELWQKNILGGVVNPNAVRSRSSS